MKDIRSAISFVQVTVLQTT